MWVYSLIGSILGTFAFFISIYNSWYARRAPVRDSQQKLRSGLKKNLLLMREHQVRTVLQGIDESGMLPDAHSTYEEMKALSQMLTLGRHDYIVPTSEDFDRLIGKVDAAKRSVIFPADDGLQGSHITHTSVHKKFADLDDEMTRFINGLTKIEKGALFHKRQFKALKA